MSVADIKYIDATDLYQWIINDKNSLGQPIQIIDVRGSDYLGGHISGCWNYPYKKLKHIDNTTEENYIDTLYNQLESKRGVDGIMNVVFHCAQSQQRGPSAALLFIRYLNAITEGNALEKYNIYVLRGGFNHWQDLYGTDELVTEDYVQDLWSW